MVFFSTHNHMQNESSIIYTPTAPGELIDKITVLKIKQERIRDESRLNNVNKELSMLEKVKERSFSYNPDVMEKITQMEESLKKANEEIWDMGDKIREYGDKKDFGEGFVKVALGIHLANDVRASIKKEINILLGSSIVEEKSYKHWK